MNSTAVWCKEVKVSAKGEGEEGKVRARGKKERGERE